MSATLAATDVGFSYRAGERVLDRVNITVTSGKLTALVGPNGSGKSTLLRLLSAHLRPDSGSIALDATPLHRIPARKRAQQIAFLPQAVDPVFALSVYETVCLGRYPHVGLLGMLSEADHARVERSLHATHTYNLRNRDFMTLSGGERQGVLLASILAQEPAIMLLDEPTAALDIHHQADILHLLRKLANEGYGIAIVTHDLNAAARIADEVVLLSEAQRGVFAFGTPEEVFTQETLSTAYDAPIRVCAHPDGVGSLILADAAAHEARS